MRNEALLMLQLARLRRELRRPLLLLEASGVEGDGVPELRQALTNVPVVVG
ncbi:hypothetical protein JYU34_010701 [Plutella xylostella]|uniref:Uncharacterized protein n=1 Tax=Plutella xylostella TaxID=51655 RepID=A0ABQ7QF19_PLUXY|nr:hypothetical protein JYU34_010701 [Plutella xylostella]